MFTDECKGCTHFRSNTCQIINRERVDECDERFCIWNVLGMCTQVDGFRNPKSPEQCNEYQPKCDTLKSRVGHENMALAMKEAVRSHCMD